MRRVRALQTCARLHAQQRLAAASAAFESAREVAQVAPGDLTSAHVKSALQNVHTMSSLPASEAVVVFQCSLRALMSYPLWLLPVAVRELEGKGPERWFTTLPAPGASSGERLLPLCCDGDAFGAITKSSGSIDNIQPATVSGVDAVSTYLPQNPNIVGVAMDPMSDGETILSHSHLPLLRAWAATLRLEAQLSALDPAAAADTRLPASSELCTSLAAAPISFLRVGSGDTADLARTPDGAIVLLTSPDAVAACVSEYGPTSIRTVTTRELRRMASEAGSSMRYSLTVGADVGQRQWRTSAVTADWLAAALAVGDDGSATRMDSAAVARLFPLVT
eukprot:TRINITY_DN32580_c0_g1_i1.p1 TRINITY_DN32580_c0_g1~~TRINITY_DN32580_c0_g1_i1.p1  ORF type:complete len:335 (+),score=53.91 TRINITY_DN32580_c0_g1_i1:65-1069(+)